MYDETVSTVVVQTAVEISDSGLVTNPLAASTEVVPWNLSSETVVGAVFGIVESTAFVVSSRWADEISPNVFLLDKIAGNEVPVVGEVIVRLSAVNISDVDDISLSKPDFVG